MALVICYFIAAFLIYSLADFFIWRKRHHDYLVARNIESMTWDMNDQHAYDEAHDGLPSINWYYRWSPSVAYTRVFFEFALPLLIGAYAACSLLLAVWRP